MRDMLQIHILESLHPEPTTPAEIASARRLAHTHATSPTDEAELLTMLGVEP